MMLSSNYQLKGSSSGFESVEAVLIIETLGRRSTPHARSTIILI